MTNSSRKSNPSHGERAAAQWAGTLLARYDASVLPPEATPHADQRKIYTNALLSDPHQLAMAVKSHKRYLDQHASDRAETPETERAFYDELEKELRKDDDLMDQIREELRREREQGKDSKRPFRPGGSKER